jgi:MvaI/BcnI restriction endonuclease family
LTLSGFDVDTNKIEDVGGAIALLDAKGSVAASWNIAKLLEHGNRKHAFAAYVPYTHRKTPSGYHYDSPILLGEGTEFPKFLSALCSQHVVYDPGCKVEGLSTGKITQKARSQFRISLKRLDALYDRIEAVNL